MPSRRQRRITTTRKSVSGRIMPPVDVRSNGDLKGLEKRIRSGPLTLVFVYADWCGHCHNFAPHFDGAVKQAAANRSVQAVKVNDAMLPAVNSYMNKNMARSEEINVEGYPSLILVDTNGKKMTEVEPVPNTNTMKNLMVKSGNIMKENMGAEAEVGVEKVENIGVKKGENIGVNMGAEAEVEVESPQRPNRNIKNSIAPSPMMVSPEMNSLLAVSNARESARRANANTNELSLLNNASPISPPSANLDIISTLTGTKEGENMVPQQGGSLYGSLATAAYELAPAGVLLAMASQVGRRSRNKGGRSRRTRRIRRA
jgi:thiol-disulfide isomerase/thioredoxin